jgi:hypothetical protein
MNSPPGLGVGHLLSQMDGVGKTTLLMLLRMSVATWYLIVAARGARSPRAAAPREAGYF